MRKQIPPIDTEDYIKQTSIEAQPILSQLTIFLREMEPTEETIKWGQPFFFFGERRVSIAAYKAHVSISFSDDLTTRETKKAKELRYTSGQKRVNVRFDQKIPEQLVKEIMGKE